MHTDLIKLLEKTSALRNDREAAADFVLQNPKYYPSLLHCAMSNDPTISKKACWVLEIVILSEPQLLDSHRRLFFNLIKHIKDGSARRPLAKIIAHWSEETISNETPGFPTLNREEIKKLTAITFNWMLNELPVAVKVFSMEALFHLGKKEAWVHEELLAYIQKNYENAQPAFKARARHLMQKLKQ
ncbi:hypothetical protein E7Z59_07395 [Robertkochia marina]|uniref:Adenylosuccinate lyase n=1 Tax=Robertkochia marina TaxID=1227945 RepID=A0A4S3LZZ1_9FLAO|nr:hypothetical protein [Robertkochia marina]THD67478.1 hypothetical protein E7Z59_07395 [Robertkochia marina]TRZ44654.1 hypothetical protein D3A96_08555 [Robertkochia marina]